MGMQPSRGRVLIVDDDPDWIDSLTDFLVEEGYSVTAAPNGQAGLEQLSRIPPLVVITDLEMPIMDGRQFLVRAREQHERTPVIVVTGKHAQRDDDTSLAGAFRIIRKPIPVEDLLAALSEAAAHRVMHLPLQKLWLAAGAALRARRDRAPRVRWAGLRRMVTASATAPIVVLILLASSLALLKHWRGSA